MIELKILSGSAAHALSTKHLDETNTPSLPPCLVVAASVLRSVLDHLRLPREAEGADAWKLSFRVFGSVQRIHDISLVFIFESII
jgi:hypothetical protein